MRIDHALHAADLCGRLEGFWKLSGEKILAIAEQYDDSAGSPVYTHNGKYTTRGWTEWTQGFQYGSAILQFDVTGDNRFLEIGREGTRTRMAPHISHIGVHDHGFNNVSTYGNLLRLMREGRLPHNEWEREFYELALRVSGAVQAARWTSIQGGGFIHSFNGPQSLFVDTIRSCRSLLLSHLLGHVFQGEGDVKINLLQRTVDHIGATAKYSVFYGKGRDRYDVRGRTAHEIIFNTKDGNMRCPNSQQGYSGFSTWTRGLAWAMCGFAEQLEAIACWQVSDKVDLTDADSIENMMLEAALATCDFYIEQMPLDGIPYWDTGAPGLVNLGLVQEKPADPFNDFEPVDSSAAAIAAQGLLRLGRYLSSKGHWKQGSRYWQAGLTVAGRLLEEPYLSTSAQHQGLLLHTIYHQPNGWDYIAPGAKVPYGESCMWGDYHARELALYLHRIICNEPYYAFFNAVR